MQNAFQSPDDSTSEDILNDLLGKGHRWLDQTLFYTARYLLEEIIFKWRNALGQDIRNVEEDSSAYGDHAEDVHQGLVEDYIYADALSGQAAVGILTPVYETMFIRFLDELKESWKGTRNADHIRTKHYKNRVDKFWNPRLVAEINSSNSKSSAKLSMIPDGFDQILESLNLENKIPDFSMTMIRALFAYRNKVFHETFQLTKAELDDFQEKVLQIDSDFENSAPQHNFKLPWYHVYEESDTRFWVTLTDSFLKVVLKQVESVSNGLVDIETQAKES